MEGTGSRRRPEEGQSRTASLGRAVRSRREELGLRQSELADLAGCSERFVHTLERGKPSLRLDKVLDALEVLGLDLLVAPGRGRIGGAPEAP
ncbi:MAG TPA: helix-turn-helix transcriptional regulator [Longimicrobiales bacterium]|nr:helix-turn-helix transcriptional regulator [Longimicrobiales bacterium]